VRVAMVLEDPEEPVEPDVDARRLDHRLIERLESHSSRLELGLDVAVGEQHGPNSIGAHPPHPEADRRASSLGYYLVRFAAGRPLADVVQWQNMSFPSSECGFDSRHPLWFACRGFTVRIGSNS
jgi:hypothetical protein